MNVIVVPEIDDFKLEVSHYEEIYISPNLGIPKLKDHNVKYIAPYWITNDFRGVNRIYEIIGTYPSAKDFTISLGNSFVLANPWTNINQNRRFEYHPLSSFGLKELMPGILVQIGVIFP